MFKNYLLYLLPISIASLFSLNSCEKVFEPDNYVAYFGGEIINPQENYVLFLKDDTIIDTLFLDENNRFLHKFDSLTPGLYTFRHNPEYQYVYFDKNDSLMIRLNAYDFDNSLAFCGRGDEKNNFLIDLFLKNEEGKAQLYDILEKPQDEFITSIDSSFNKTKTFYLKRKAQIGWSKDFDEVAQASLNFNYYYKKELYPYAHKYKTGECILKKLPDNFYEYRNRINYNDDNLANFSPFVKYVTVMLNNVTYKNCKGEHFDEMSLDNNISKLNIIDTLIKNQKIKNIVLNNVAYMYLLEDQNMYNNKKFIDRYLELSTDKEQQKEVSQIYNSVQNLKIGNPLPKISLIDSLSNPIDIADLTHNKRTVVFFWTSHADSHVRISHKKIRAIQAQHPELNFVAVNINDTKDTWMHELKKYNFKGVTELHANDFEEIKKQWVITKIHRTILLNPDGTIENAFANLFDIHFEKSLNQ
jgi:hypothetical protein